MRAEKGKVSARTEPTGMRISGMGALTRMTAPTLRATAPAIPKTPKVGLAPKAGQEMGVRFWMQGFLPPTKKNPNPRYAFEMFDSCEYGYFKLVDAAPAR